MAIDKKTMEHLAGLARIELNAQEEERLLQDLKKILEHFDELKNVDTSKVPPMSGGTELKNVFRDDSECENTNRGEGADQFPETHDGYLKIPPVFEV